MDDLLRIQLSSISFLVMMLFLSVAVITDFRSRKIPNWLSGTGIVVGLVLSALSDPSGPGTGTHLVGAILGCAVGLVLLLPAYAIGKLGGGDVKLMAMCGAFMGVHGVFWATMYSLIAGGFLAVLWILFHVGHRSAFYRCVGLYSLLVLPGGGDALKVSEDSPLKAHMPYAAAIATGVMIFQWVS